MALVVVLALGLPAVFLFATALADGEVRRREAPLRAMLGNEAYEALAAGQPSGQHYMGRDRGAPDFELPSSQGGTFRLSEQRGKVVILNFWTVTCQPCVEEMPSLVSLATMLEGRDDIVLAAITIDPDWETARSVVPQGSPLTVLLDPDRAVVRDLFGTRMYPETWIIDSRGIIRLRVDGRRDWSSPLAMQIFEGYR